MAVLVAMFSLRFCSLRVHKFWCVGTFLAMTNICAATHEEILALYSDTK